MRIELPRRSANIHHTPPQFSAFNRQSCGNMNIIIQFPRFVKGNHWKMFSSFLVFSLGCSPSGDTENSKGYLICCRVGHAPPPYEDKYTFILPIPPAGHPGTRRESVPAATDYATPPQKHIPSYNSERDRCRTPHPVLQTAHFEWYR